MCVYVIGFTDGLFPGVVKIGVTNNVKKRLQQLQTGNPWRLHAIGIMYRPDAFQYEDWLHERFAKYRMRQDGEWFDFGPESDPVAIVESVL